MERMSVECTGIIDGGSFPLDNTGYGKNLSPEFIIHDLPDKAVTFAVTLEDMGHPIHGFTHWVIWNIPASDRITGSIPSGKSVQSLGGAKQGTAYGLHRYAGSKPPHNSVHSYRFTIYALDCKLSLKASANKRKFLKCAEEHILQFRTLTASFGLYHHEENNA